MKDRLTFDEARALLPDVAELRPVLDEVLRASHADPDRAWTGSGELGTVGGRILNVAEVRERLETILERTTERLSRVYGHVGAALAYGEAGDPPAAARALLEAAAVEEGAGRASEAARFAEAAHRLVEGIPNCEETAIALRRWARSRRAEGALEDALRLYGRAREIARALQDTPGWAEAAIGGGNVLEQMGRWGDAEAWYRDALAVLDRVTPISPAHWHASLNLHILFRTRGDVDASRPWLDRAREQARSVDDPTSKTFLENARGQLLMADDEPDAAERAFQEALSSTATSFASVTVRLNLAESLLAMGRILDAGEQARTAEREAIAGRATPKLPETYRMLGRVADAAGNPDAFVLFERSLELAGAAESMALERAMTLQAYADTLDGDAAAVADLTRQSHETYRRLGVPRARRRWADCFDGASTAPTDPPTDSRGP